MTNVSAFLFQKAKLWRKTALVLKMQFPPSVSPLPVRFPGATTNGHHVVS